jgi:uncharacterized protein YndB with AHSA1/START domain
VGVDVVTETEIARPRADVAAFATDPMNATRWYRNIEAVAWETSPPLEVGSWVRFRARFLGRTLEYTHEILELDPLERLVMATASGPLAMETTYTWSDAAGGTRMTLRNRGQLEGPMKMARPVLEAAMRRANRADLARLNSLLEAT